jgi:hypothetical protein
MYLGGHKTSAFYKSRIRQTRRRIRKTHREEDIGRLKAQLEGWNIAVQRAKVGYWHKCLAETNRQTVWKAIRKHNTHHKPTPPLNGASTFKGKCQILRSALFPDPAIQIADLAPDTILSKSDLREVFSPITPSEVRDTLKRCKTDTAPVPDQITYSIVRAFHSAVPAILPALFNAIYKYEIIPDEWKASNYVVIPKEGGNDYTVLASYRPISMSACIGKVMESLTAPRLSAVAFRCSAMSRMKMGGIQDNSATDSLIYTLTPMSNALKIPPGKGRQIPPGSQPSLLTVQIMEQRQMPSYLVNWTRAFTTNRTAAFAFDCQSETPKPFTNSILQGSPASPTLFTIAANAFLENPTIQYPYPTSFNVQPTKTIKQLGVIIDESLNFLKHTKHAASKGMQSLGHLRFL